MRANNGDALVAAAIQATAFYTNRSSSLPTQSGRARSKLSRSTPRCGSGGIHVIFARSIASSESAGND